MRTIKGPRLRFRRNLLAVALLLAVPATAGAATVHGSTDAAVVWVSAPAAIPKPVEASMRNHERTFDPPFVVVPVGGSVRFPNDDPFYHSIYSDSGANSFDIGYYGEGPGKSVTFSKPGILEVHCHIHAYMRAWIVVADGPFAQVAQGSYTITGVPAGKLTLRAWDPDRGVRSISIDVPSDDAQLTADIKTR